MVAATPCDLLKRSCLPPPAQNFRQTQLGGLHRDHKTKAGQAFPAAGREITTRKAPAVITICGPLAA